MEYTQLGKTGAKVSRLGFGGAPAGLTNYLDDYNPANDKQRQSVVDAIRKALELGITYFDTAAAYGRGEGESIFGEGLADASDDIFIATKVAPRDSGANVRASLETSLKNLRRDSVDLLQIHGGSYSSDDVELVLGKGGMLEQMEQLRDEGLIRFIGFTSEDNNAPVYKFIETGRFDMMQVAYNLAFQHPAEYTRPFGSMFEAEKMGMGICTMRTATSGLVQKWIQMVNPDNTFDYTPALIQFVLSNPIVDVALVGMRTPEEVEMNVRICEDTSGRIDLEKLHEKYV